MQKVEKEQMGLIAPLFENWPETMIWSCLDGSMGTAWADSLPDPRSARILTGDFCFFAGEPREDLVSQFSPRPFLLMAAQDPGWDPLIEKIHAGHCRPITRYAFHKDPSVFDPERLEQLQAAVPEGYTLREIDAPLYRRAMEAEWSRDLVSQFSDAEDFLRRGIGVAALKDGELVGGASSYTVYHGGIEIEIDTREDHRRRGLARCCAAALILACLRRGLYPSWDAANPMSAALAAQLGYRPAGEYRTYELDLSQN
ncbi:MAG: GNAT family N-acetyltransferase [Oscillospiraceae bacterium]|nr:GNAT family N-acetyltransferase [Oscillospiraceae bacterium]